MKTFTAPAWLKNEPHHGTFTYTPVPHPDDLNSDQPCPPCPVPCTPCVILDDDTPFDTGAWQSTTDADGVETYTLTASDSDTMNRGMLTLQQEASICCRSVCCNKKCMPYYSQSANGDTIIVCKCV